jgi:type IV pilus assembly protein PilV
VGLLEAMVSLAILAFGLLAMLRFEARLITQGTEAQSRSVAVQLGDELLDHALVDAGNAACYTVPAAGPCASATASAFTTDWVSRVRSSLPGTVTIASQLAGTQLQVAVGWTGKATLDQHTLQVATDVRQ